MVLGQFLLSLPSQKKLAVDSVQSVWLIETARTLPEAQLDGYDISPSQFPAKERLPKNVKLATLDAFGLIPEDLVGKYDVVHISLFVMLVRNENPAPVLENLMLMLSKCSRRSDLASTSRSMRLVQI